MSTATKIEWTEVTWNPTTGCDRISPGCDHCYALTLAKRLKAMGQAKYQRDGDPRTSGPGFGVTMHADVLAEPLRWRTPRKVFVNSMSDVGHARISRSFVAQTWAVMALARRHTFQVLTKRPKRLAVMLADHVFMRQVGMAATEIIGRTPHGVWHMDMTGWTPEGGIEDRGWMPPWPLPKGPRRDPVPLARAPPRTAGIPRPDRHRLGDRRRRKRPRFPVAGPGLGA